MSLEHLDGINLHLCPNLLFGGAPFLPFLSTPNPIYSSPFFSCDRTLTRNLVSDRLVSLLSLTFHSTHPNDDVTTDAIRLATFSARSAQLTFCRDADQHPTAIRSKYEGLLRIETSSTPRQL